jgi:hypothetical protein
MKGKSVNDQEKKYNHGPDPSAKIMRRIKELRECNKMRETAIVAITKTQDYLISLNLELPMIKQQIAEYNTILTLLGQHSIDAYKVIENYKIEKINSDKMKDLK